ncbi:protealysin inhibitor emfourin [Rhodococcus sp. NPDC059234]|uniref:protealysin inhibitor emfourin n=1 Tax=Rhodococcus sp. NPDC059234 TaxID=3346781 RepID=UPI00366C1A2E
MSNPPVRVEYRRSGGLAGIDMTASVDVQDLPLDQQQRVTALMTDPDGDTSSAGVGGVPDRFSYELAVSDGDRTWTHHWTESQVPEAVRPLLAALGDRAHPAPPR